MTKNKERLFKLADLYGLLPAIVGIGICVGGLIGSSILAGKQYRENVLAYEAYCEAKAELTEITVTQKYASRDYRTFYLHYDLPYQYKNPKGELQSVNQYMTIEVTNNEFDDARIGSVIDVSDWDADDKGYCSFERRMKEMEKSEDYSLF